MYMKLVGLDRLQCLIAELGSFKMYQMKRDNITHLGSEVHESICGVDRGGSKPPNNAFAIGTAFILRHCFADFPTEKINQQSEEPKTK